MNEVRPTSVLDNVTAYMYRTNVRVWDVGKADPIVMREQGHIYSAYEYRVAEEDCTTSALIRTL